MGVVGIVEGNVGEGMVVDGTERENSPPVVAEKGEEKGGENGGEEEGNEEGGNEEGMLVEAAIEGLNFEPRKKSTASPAVRPVVRPAE